MASSDAALDSIPMDMHRFCETRPCLYHLTATSNIDSIFAIREIVSAASILRGAGMEAHLRTKRAVHLPVEVNGRSILLRDQRPFHCGNCRFEGGWDCGDVLTALNERVFFWPGDLDGPIDYGVRHFERYAGEACSVLVVPTAELLASNADRTPQVCRYNSGSPRCTGGRGSPRGPQTFVQAESFAGTPGTVREVTFTERVILPKSTRVTDLRDWL